MTEHKPDIMYGTTIITVRKGGKVVMAGDGQVSLGQTIMKGNARKVRRLGKAEWLLLVLQVLQQMRSHYWKDWKQSLSNILISLCVLV